MVSPCRWLPCGGLQSRKRAKVQSWPGGRGRVNGSTQTFRTKLEENSQMAGGTRETTEEELHIYFKARRARLDQEPARTGTVGPRNRGRSRVVQGRWCRVGRFQLPCRIVSPTLDLRRVQGRSVLPTLQGSLGYPRPVAARGVQGSTRDMVRCGV